MRQYPDDHGGLFDGANDLQGAATIRALLDVNVEDALEQSRPTHARRCAATDTLCCTMHFPSPSVGYIKRWDNGFKLEYLA